MTKDEAINRFGSQVALAKALGMSQSTISTWGEYPPPLRQLQIEKITGSKLKAERNVFERRPKAEAEKASAA